MSHCGGDVCKETLYLLLVKLANGPEAAADIETKRANFVDGISDVVRIQTSGQKDRNPHGLHNSPADAPIMLAARATEFFHCELLVAGIE